MTKIHILNSSRLTLRQWQDSDFEPFSRLNADKLVMEYYPKLLSVDDSNLTAKRFQTLIAKNGWGFWAVETNDNQEFIGFIGLHKPDLAYDFAPCTEIGWRLKKEAWGNGYATEGAITAINFAFQILNIDEILSFTSIHNQRSEMVMKRIGMTNTNQNFRHPNLHNNDRLSEHVLYRITKSTFLSTTKN
tara:strand:+ start:266 stop:832 length:567 start_codon:yes stop_codon:yes gene_type:complete